MKQREKGKERERGEKKKKKPGFILSSRDKANEKRFVLLWIADRLF